MGWQISRVTGFMDCDSRAFETTLSNFSDFSELVSVPLRRPSPMAAQPIIPWTPLSALAALARLAFAVPRLAPAVVRVTRDSRD